MMARWLSRKARSAGAGRAREQGALAKLHASEVDGSADQQSRNQFIAGRRAFTGAFADLARGKRNWQLVAFVSLGMLAVLVLAYVRLASTARIVPYVVAVDKLGQVAAVGPADRWRAPDSVVIAAQLAEFVRNVRTVLPAAAARAQAGLLERAYAYVDQNAARFLNQYFAEPAHDPRVVGEARTREVHVTSVRPVPQSTTWRLRWTETEFPVQAGGTVRAAVWEGDFVVRLVPPTTVDAVTANPFGIYITDLSWTEIAEREGGGS